MRNKYPGICYRCNKAVAAGEGHFERALGGWKVQHADCALVHRGTDVGVDTKERDRMKEIQRRLLHRPRQSPDREGASR